MNLEKIGQIWKEKLLKKTVIEMSFTMNTQKRKWAVVVVAVLKVPHHIKNQVVVISTGKIVNNNIYLYTLIII